MESPRQKIFVTGATGFIGGALVSNLASNPSLKVYALVRRSDEVNFFEKIGAFPVVSTFDSLKDYSDILKSCEVIYHLAANASFRNRGEYEQSNVESTRLLCDLLKDSPNLKRFVFTSTIGAVDRSSNDPCNTPLNLESPTVPTSVYGRSKLQAEKIVAASGLPYTILRLPWVYGPGMRSDSHVATFLRLGFMAHPLSRVKFSGRASAIFITDLVQLMTTLIESKSAIHAILYPSTSEPLEIGSILNVGLKAGGHSNWQFSTNFVKPFIAKLPLPFALKVMLQDALVTQSDLPLLNFTPQISNEEGLKKTFAHWQNQEGVHVITGAASGLGKSFAQALTKQGKKVLLVDVDSKRLEALSKDLNQRFLTCDLSSSAGNTTLVEHINREPIAGLIACAGIGARGDFDKVPSATHKKLIAINITSVIDLSSAVLNKFKSAGQSGYLILIASSVSIVPTPGMALYGASKSLILSLGRSLFGEYIGSGIRILTVCPSGINTNFQKAAGVKVIEEGRGLLSPDSVVAASLHALDKGKVEIWIGWKSRLITFILSFLPSRLWVTVWAKLFAKLR